MRCLRALAMAAGLAASVGAVTPRAQSSASIVVVVAAPRALAPHPSRGTGFKPPRTRWSPICATFEPGSLEWYWFFCWVDPPPKDPSA